MQMKVSDEMNFETRVELSMLKELTSGTINRSFRICRMKCDGFSSLSKLPIFRPSQ